MSEHTRTSIAPTVVMLLKTNGLEYDDRVRKECLSLRACGEEPLIVVLENRNRTSTGVTEQGVSYQAVRLLCRYVFPRKKGLVFKTCEMYLRFITRALLARPRAVWLHNMELAGLLPFFALLRRLGRIRRVIWDQHELPAEWMMRSRLGRLIFTWLCSLADAIVVASPERKQVLARLNERLAEKHIYVLENYPDDHFANLPRGPIPTDLQAWLNGRPYFVAQSGAAPKRRFKELAEAIMANPDFCLVVIGLHDEGVLRFLDQRYGRKWRSQIYFTGFIPQLQLHRYLDGAIGSVVFYANVSLNNWLCAPNRLYQAISREVPVLVGANPPMASVVLEHNCGVVLASDGSDPKEIARGLVELRDKQDIYKGGARAASRRMLWNAQNGIVAAIIRPSMELERDAPGNPAQLQVNQRSEGMQLRAD